MLSSKHALASLAICLGLSGGALAQAPGAVSRAVPGGFSGYPGPGSNFDYYSLSTGFGNYGLPGTFSGYAGHALSGYGPGAAVGAYFTAPTTSSFSKTPPKGEIPVSSPTPRTIKQPKGKPGGDGYVPQKGVARPRRSR